MVTRVSSLFKPFSLSLMSTVLPHPALPTSMTGLLLAISRSVKYRSLTVSEVCTSTACVYNSTLIMGYTVQMYVSFAHLIYIGLLRCSHCQTARVKLVSLSN